MKKEKASSENQENREPAVKKAKPRSAAPVAAPAETAVTKVGSLLKEMRLQKGLKLPDIAKKLCIRRIYLEAIEESNYKEIPEFPYGVGFIRSYADFLGLNSSNIVELYKEETDSGPDKDIFVLEPQTEATVPGKKYLLISLLAVIVVYFGWYAYNNHNSADDIAAVETIGSNLTDDTVNPLPLVVEDYSVSAETPDAGADLSVEQPLAVIDASQNAETASPQVVMTDAAFTGTAEIFPQPVETSAAPAADEVKPAKKGVVINVLKETWIEVKDADKLYISKVLQPGDTYTVPAGRGMILSVGKMDGVEVVINGVPTNVFTSNRKSNIALDKFSAANR